MLAISAPAILNPVKCEVRVNKNPAAKEEWTVGWTGAISMPSHAKQAYISIEEIGEGSLVCNPSFLVELHGGGGTSLSYKAQDRRNLKRPGSL